MKITRLVTKSGETIVPGSFTLLVGPNGVGKSTFVAELFDRISGRNPQTQYWVDKLEFAEDDPSSTARTLRDGLVKCFDKPNPGNFWYQPVRFQPGENANDLRIDQNRHKMLSQIGDGVFEQVEPTSFICNDAVIRRALTSYHSCETRLMVPPEAERAFPYANPPDIPNILLQREGLREHISNELHGLFGLNLQLLLHTGRTIEVGVSEVSAPQTLEGLAFKAPLQWYEQTEKWKEGNFVSIDRAGHGIRAALNLLISVADPMRQIVLVDEPELFLFPQAKRTIGRMLVDLSEPSRQVIVVTHDAATVQGVLDSRKDVRVIRLDFGDRKKDRTAKIATFNQLPPGQVGHYQAGYLEVLFAPAALVVEGPTDRLFYQSILTDYLSDIAPKLMVAAAGGGKSEAVKVARICTDAGTRHRTVLDFDALFNTSQALEPILHLNLSSFDISVLAAELNGAISDISQASGQSEDDARTSLKASGVGSAGLSGLTSRSLGHQLNLLKKDGVFIVPSGGLESWCPTVRGKAKFVESALAEFQARADLVAPVRDFLREAASGVVI